MRSQDYLREIEESGGLKRLIFRETGVFADSSKSNNAALFVFIDGETDKNTYLLEFSHCTDGGALIIDKVEKFGNLFDAVLRFERINSVIHNLLVEEQGAKPLSR